MVSCANVLLDVQEAAEVCCKLGSETDISVRYDFVGDAIVRGYMGGIECGYSF